MTTVSHFGPIWYHLKPKMPKICQNCLKYHPWAGPGGSDQKIFFQKVITYQDGTFLWQKFFSKTNISGFWNFLDPLGPKIQKIVAFLGKATIFDLVPASFVTGATFSSGKIGVNTFIGGVKRYPQSAPHLSLSTSPNFKEPFFWNPFPPKRKG